MSYRANTIIAALLSAAVLTGCHTAKALIPPNFRPSTQSAVEPIKLARKQLLQASPCCSSFADFSYRNLLPWQPEKFTLGNGSMVANLDGTRSYFLAFQLPTALKVPYRVALKSDLNGRWLHDSYLFAPTVVMLDAGFQPIDTDDITLCEHMGWSDETTGAFGSFKVTSKAARYLLVYSSAKQQAGKTYWEQSPASINNISATATLQMNSTGSFSIPHGPNGSLWIGLINSTYEKAIDSSVCGKAPKGDGVLNSLPLPWSSKRTNAS